MNLFKLHTDPKQLIAYNKPYVITNSDGSKEWYLNGKRHRIDGPAIEWSNGTKEWWVNGKRYKSQHEINWASAGLGELIE